MSDDPTPEWFRREFSAAKPYGDPSAFPYYLETPTGRLHVHFGHTSIAGVVTLRHESQRDLCVGVFKQTAAEDLIRRAISGKAT